MAKKINVANAERILTVQRDASYALKPTFFQGRYQSGSVIEEESNIYVRTGFYLIDTQSKVEIRVVSNAYTFYAIWIDSDGNYLGNTGSKSTGYTYDISTTYPNARYVALMVWISGGSPITPSDVAEHFTIMQTVVNSQIPINQKEIKYQLKNAVAKTNKCGSIFKVLEFESGRFNSGTGLPSDNPNWVRTKEPILVNPNLPYIVSRTHSTNITVYEYDEDYKWIREYVLYSSSSGYGNFRNLNPACYYVNFGIPSTSGDTTIFEQRTSFDNENNLQDYFLTQLESKVPEIVHNMNDAWENGTTFVFITDPHWNSNYKSSPSLIRYVLGHTNIHNVFFFLWR